MRAYGDKWHYGYGNKAGLGSVMGTFARNNNALALSALLEEEYADPNLMTNMRCQLRDEDTGLSSRIIITPLWEAVINDNYEAAEVLLEFGADTEFKMFGRTPIMGRRNDRPLSDDMIELLLSHGARSVDEEVGRRLEAYQGQNERGLMKLFWHIGKAFEGDIEQGTVERIHGDFVFEGYGYNCREENARDYLSNCEPASSCPFDNWRDDKWPN